MLQFVVKLVEPVELPLLAPSSTNQRSVVAGVVVQTTLTLLTFVVIVCVIGVKLTIRGPRPPDGLTTSVDWLIVRGVPPRSVHATLKVVRRKSSPLLSPVAP